MTVREVGRLIRERFNKMKSDSSLFASFEAICTGNQNFTSLHHLFAGMSDIGWFRCPPPIVDCWAQQTLKSKCNGCYPAFSCFSKMKHGVNTISRFLQPTTLLNDRGSAALARSVVHAMRNIEVEAKMQQAFDEIRKLPVKGENE